MSQRLVTIIGRASALSTGLLLFFGPGSALANCSAALLGDPLLANKVRHQIERTKKVSIVFTQNARTAETSLASFHQNKHEILLLPGASPLQDQLNLHHEAVHATSLYNFKTKPSPKTAAWLISFDSDELIDKELPQAYQHGFILDEAKALYKTSRYFAAIVRHEFQLGPEEKEVPLRNVVRSYHSSKTIQRMAKFWLNQLMETISSAAMRNHFPIGTQLNIYNVDMPSFYLVSIPLSRPNGSPVIAHLPIYLPSLKAAPGARVEVHPKKLAELLLETCQYGLSFQNRYQSPPKLK